MAGILQWGMAKPRRPRDTNQLAKLVVELSTGETTEDPYEGKNPAAVELGRRGGIVGGRVRAAKLTPQQRANIGQTLIYARRKKRSNKP